MVALSERFATLSLQPDGQRELRRWLHEFVEFHAVHAGVFRAWVEEEPQVPRLVATARSVARAALESFKALVAPVTLPAGIGPSAVSGLLLALLERLPDEGAGTRYELSAADVVETVAAFVERGILHTGAESDTSVHGA
jgi:hypothetical protein